jgi:hypothetical protein
LAPPVESEDRTGPSTPLGAGALVAVGRFGRNERAIGDCRFVSAPVSVLQDVGQTSRRQPANLPVETARRRVETVDRHIIRPSKKTRICC